MALPRVEVESLSKKYSRNLRSSLKYGLQDALRQSFGAKRNAEILRAGEFWALQNVSFKIQPGESIGILGPNGSGKTTLLKILGGLLKPDLGRCIVRGTVAPLFAKGAGFNRALSGYENIRLNLLLYGLSRELIESRVPEILEFAEIHPDLLHAPVRTYSSGTLAKLGFACAMATRPDILLIDEALAVGDLRFRNKCYRELDELTTLGSSLIMVSHSLSAMHLSTKRCIYLKFGELLCDGPTGDVTTFYENDLLLSRFDLTQLDSEEPISNALGFDILGSDHKTPLREMKTGQLGFIYMQARNRNFNPGEAIHIQFESVSKKVGVLIRHDYQIQSECQGLEMDLPELSLVAGVYKLNIQVSKGSQIIANQSIGLRINSPAEISQNLMFQKGLWEIRSDQLE